MSAPSATASPLDLHEEMSHPATLAAGLRERTGGCSRWPKGLRLRASTGVMVTGRCGASNLCAYCAGMASVVHSEMLAIDAMDEAPAVWMVLTTPRATTDMTAFYDSRRLLVRALKRRLPELRYLWILEYTTGEGAKSGGRRRPHWNVFLKGVTPEDVPVVRDVVRKVWCAREGASPRAQYVEGVRDRVALTKYTALHFLKESQRPPEGFSGSRVGQSKDYYSRPGWALRQAAETSLRHKRAVWRANRDGYEGTEALVIAEAAIAAAPTWELVVTTVDDVTGELRGVRRLDGGIATVAGYVPGARVRPWEPPPLERGELEAIVGRALGTAAGPPPVTTQPSPAAAWLSLAQDEGLAIP